MQFHYILMIAFIHFIRHFSSFLLIVKLITCDDRMLFDHFQNRKKENIIILLIKIRHFRFIQLRMEVARQKKEQKATIKITAESK